MNWIQDPYQNSTRQLDVFHKQWLYTIYIILWKLKYLILICFQSVKIRGIQTFLMQSQLQWAGFDERTPKIPMYSQLHDSTWRMGQPLLRYSDKLIQHLNSIDVPLLSFEVLDSNHATWRNMYIKEITTFEYLHFTKLHLEFSLVVLFLALYMKWCVDLKLALSHWK